MKSEVNNDAEVENLKKGFVTTGINIGLKKFRYINLAFGSSWSEFSQLSPKYKADEFIPAISAAEIAVALNKKIKTAFFVGLNINL